MQKTGIEWAECSWNPVVGCKPKSAGCLNCYAAQMAATRLKHTPKYKGLTKHYQWNGGYRVHAHEIAELETLAGSREIFVCSMGDLFYEAVPEKIIVRILVAAAENSRHRFFFLTKRPARMQQIILDFFGKAFYSAMNIAIGVSVEHQGVADFRIPLLLDTPAGKRFISTEPLLAPLHLKPWLPYLQGVFTGAETGPGARKANPGWFRQIRDECAAAGTPFTLKQINAKRDRTFNGAIHQQPLFH